VTGIAVADDDPKLIAEPKLKLDVSGITARSGASRGQCLFSILAGGHRPGAEKPSVTGSGWELAIVLVMSSTSFWSAWHFVAQLLH
jgi:hypothetical protein